MSQLTPGQKPVLFAVTVFSSAFLLFQVQPLLGKFILPWFGGTPAVWTMCMLVFQSLLFGGYAYAHLLSRIGRPVHQALIHSCLLAGATALLPIVPDAAWKPVGDEIPAIRIPLLLMATVGGPYFLLSATGPLLQKWFSRACPGSSPYRLYALSNAGSLLALLSYPFVVEPALSSTSQAWFWSVGFAVFALACMLCGWSASMAGSSSTTTNETLAGASDSPSRITRVRWFFLAMLPSIMLLATTNEVCMDIAVVPFLWILPLALYLLSFILTFESDRFCNRRVLTMAAAVSLAGTAMMLSWRHAVPIVVLITVCFGNLFLVCMQCHAELVHRRPSATHLTSFYLTMSAGGAAGGLFVGLAAPVLFSSYAELSWAVFCALLVCVGSWLNLDRRFSVTVPDGLVLKIGTAISAGLLVYFCVFNAKSEKTVVATRNFYGVLRIDQEQQESTGVPVRDLVHGRIVHGRQILTETERRTPTTYYTPNSGIGMLLKGKSEKPRRVGVVGLGAGTLAAYGQSGDVFRFYEINLEVIRLAQEHFTFLSDTPASVELIPGDARLVLEREADQAYDVLVLDAFSGDAIPVHLLTAEAMDIYRRHLKPDGVLAIHVSNSYFDLVPVVRGQANRLKMECRFHETPEDEKPGISLISDWMLLSSSTERLNAALGTSGLVPETKTVFWTDDRNNLLTVLK